MIYDPNDRIRFNLYVLTGSLTFRFMYEFEYVFFFFSVTVVGYDVLISSTLLWSYKLPVYGMK